MDCVKRIRLRAKQKRRSLTYLCEKIGVTKVYFNDIEKDGREIPFERLEIIAQELDTTPEYLLGETDDSEIRKPSAVSWRGNEMSEDRAKIMDMIASLSEEDAVKAERILETLLEGKK